MDDKAANVAAITKRPAAEEAEGNRASKRLLQSNQFASLPDGANGPLAATTPKARRQRKLTPQQQQEQQQQQLQRKEKCPPIVAYGFPPNLRDDIRRLIAKGLKCTFKMCHDGTKLLTESVAHYEVVVRYLEEKGYEYYTHDFPGRKPLKVVLHGLDEDWSTDQVKEELIANGLKPVGVYTIRRQNEATNIYRDNLYLVHLERGSITMKELQSIRTIYHTIVEWARYRPKQRDVTQCTNCLRFGHGTKHCRINPRCNRCGEDHGTSECQKMAEADPKCANCEKQHPATAKACTKRAEYLAIRKRASTKNQPTSRRAQPPALNDQNFPAIPPPRRPIPVLPPLQPHKRLAAAAATTNPWPTLPPPGFRHHPEPEPPITDDTAPLYTPEQLLPIFQQLSTRLRSCKTRYDQIYTLGIFVIQNA